MRGYLQGHLFNVCCISEAVRTAPPQGQPLPPDYGPPPYEATQPGFLPPHVPGEGPMPMPMPMPPPPQGATDYLHIYKEMKHHTPIICDWSNSDHIISSGMNEVF